MLNILMGLAIITIMFLTPIATLMVMGEIFALIVTKTHSKICAIIIICEVIFEIFLILYLIGRGVLI